MHFIAKPPESVKNRPFSIKTRASEIKFSQQERTTLCRLAENPRLLRDLILEAHFGNSTVVSVDVSPEVSLYAFISDRIDVEKDAMHREHLAHLIACIESLPPNFAYVLDSRIRGIPLHEMAEHLNMSREGVRQIEEKAHLLLMLDPDIRDLSSSMFGRFMGKDVQEKINAIEYLSNLGFSRNFILKWGVKKLPSFEKIIVVAVSIAEKLYPYCMKEDVNDGDRLDKYKFENLLKRIALRDLCKICDIPDLKKMQKKLDSYLSSRFSLSD
jgi:hypothetical protein